MDKCVDVDDVATWPARLLERVDRWAAQHRGMTLYTPDLPLSAEDETPFRELLQGHDVRAYHLTRLLPHERELIRSGGLRALTAQLVDQRIEAAFSVGALSTTERDALQKLHVFANGQAGNRKDQVCLVLSEQMLHRETHGCVPLLSAWGGEAIYVSGLHSEHADRLRQLGSPSIIVARLRFGDPAEPRHLVFPGLHKLFVGARLGLELVGADVFYKASIPGHRIEAIWQPGQDAYDVFESLPRS